MCVQLRRARLAGLWACIEDYIREQRSTQPLKAHSPKAAYRLFQWYQYFEANATKTLGAAFMLGLAPLVIAAGPVFHSKVGKPVP